MAKQRAATQFFHHRVYDVLAALCLALAAFIATALLSFHPHDPSLNFATDEPVRNLMGYAGAWLSNPLLGLFGAASFALIPIAASWAWRVYVDKSARLLWLRAALTLFALPVFAALLMSLDYALEQPEGWPTESYGGFLGGFIYSDLVPLMSTGLYWGVITVLSVALIYGTVALRNYEWYVLFYYIRLVLAWLINAVGWLLYRPVILFDAIQSWRSRRREARGDEEELEEVEEDEDAEEDEEAQPSKRRTLVKVALPQKKEPPLKKNKPRMARQESLSLGLPGEYELPDIDLLKLHKQSHQEQSPASLKQNAQLLQKVLKDFGVQGEITQVHPGPVVTLYELQPSAGTKSSRVIGLADDIARSMSAVSARIAVIPGQNAIGIELPNERRQMVYLRELFETPEYQSSTQELSLVLGKNIGGEPVIMDLARMPHLLIAGTTGSGKSVGINTMILSLLYKYTPHECRLIMIDPKMLELSVYEGIPHLLSPVVTEPGKAVVALKWTVKEMENRYKLMSNLGVRNIKNFNQRIVEAIKNKEELSRTVQTGFDPGTGKPIYETLPIELKPLPYIVVIVDEMADLMIVAGKDIESSIQRLAQMARAAGIHIIMATQRPSVDVITGVIKANFPTRISFQVTSRIDSRTILGDHGAEQLLGQGDMLYMAGGSRITRVHGPFVDDKEVEKVVSFLKTQGEPTYVEDVTKGEEEDGSGEFGGEGDEGSNEMYDKAVAVVVASGRASTSFVQRQLKIGYNRAANLIEEMEQNGVISAPNHAGKREVLGQ